MRQSRVTALRLFSATALALGLGQHAYSQVFKCIENGRNVYSDKPCNGDRAPIHKGAVSVMPSQQSNYYSPPPNYQNDYYENSAPANNSGGQAFSRSPSNPNGRPTISKLLPNGGSIADRQKRSSSRKSAPPPPPQPSTMTHCAGGFCNDNLGSQYHRIGGGMMVSPSGKVCNTVGDMVYCN